MWSAHTSLNSRARRGPNKASIASVSSRVLASSAAVAASKSSAPLAPARIVSIASSTWAPSSMASAVRNLSVGVRLGTSTPSRAVITATGNVSENAARCSS